MSRQTTDSIEQFQSLVSRLSETVKRVDADDLSGLAQMHGWCESLIETAKDTSASDTGLVTSLTKITRDLEALIVGEVSNAIEALAAIAESIQQITTLTSNDTEPVQETEPEGQSDEWSEPQREDLSSRSADDVASSLARVFDETPVDECEPLAEPPIASASPVASAPPKAEPPAAPKAETPSVASYVAEPLIIDAKELDFVKGFVEEAREHIEAIEAAVLEVERLPNDTAKIDDLFRPFHTIKGMAGFLNLRDVNCLTHEAETLLDQGRKGQRTVSPGVIDLVLCVVDVLKVQIASIGQWVADPNSNPVEQPPVSEIIDRLRGVVSGKLNPDELSASAGSTKPAAATADVIEDAPGTPPVREGSSGPTEAPTSKPVPAAPVAVAAPVASAGTAGPKLTEQSIRIDTEKLDALIDMVGELVIAQTLVNMSGEVAGNPKLTKDVTQVTKIVRDVQELAMAMRMVPIGPTFQKMARLIRDVSRKAGKQVNLTISGEDTELDKTVIQEIGDPLVHMVRNAVDHGVESPEARAKAGKPETGAVHLHAGHEGGNIVISISDDGKGLDPAVLVAKAIEKGVIEPGTELTDQQAFALVFAPGFSTAAQVTDISGRGVGMDVVKRNIEQLRGRVEITSEKGKGTTFIIRLPLTLAIIDGMVIRTGSERFILPTITIQQSLRPRPELITTVNRRGELLNVRGELIPLIQLGELFGLTDRIDPCQAMVIIAHCEGRLVGLVVEELIGQQQVVIKSLGERFERLRGVSGAAILGDGRVGLILETSGLSAANDSITRTTRLARVNRSQSDSKTSDNVQDNHTAPQSESAAELDCRQENNK
jgi:two-component system chemotaxis sensor kinase CheA